MNASYPVPRSGWREHARQVAQRIVSETRDLPEEQREAERKRRFHDDYPFGERRYYPYQVWLQEVRLAKGLARVGDGTPRPDPAEAKLAERARKLELDGQKMLFAGEAVS